MVDIHIAQEKARRGDVDGAIELSRTVLDDLVDSGGCVWSALALVFWVEALLHRGGDEDLAAAQAAIDRLGTVPPGAELVPNEITLLRLRALLARARGDEAAYEGHRDRYRTMANSLGFDGHMAWADAMA